MFGSASRIPRFQKAWLILLAAWLGRLGCPGRLRIARDVAVDDRRGWAAVFYYGVAVHTRASQLQAPAALMIFQVVLVQAIASSILLAIAVAEHLRRPEYSGPRSRAARTSGPCLAT